MYHMSRMRVPFPVFLAVFVCSPLLADNVTPTPLSPATMEQMAGYPHSITSYTEQNKGRERLRSFSAQSRLGAAPEVLTPGTTQPPKVTAGFRALQSGIPPADASGAVSARYVVNITNDGVTVNDRAGALLSGVRLDQFWSDPSLPPGILYDPRVIYDAVNDRFAVITLVEAGNRGRLLFAFTASGDPTGAWKRFIMSFDDAGQLAGDFTNMGQTSDSILITVNGWEGSSAYAFVIGKAYGGTPPVQRSRFGSTVTDLVPITTSDASRKIALSGANGGVLIYDLVGNNLTNPKNYGASPALSNRLCGAQLGASFRLDCGVGDLETAVQRNGVIWLVQAPLGRVLIWRISSDTVTSYLIDSGDTTYAYSSIAVNRTGAALVAYSVFSPLTYASAGYSYIDPNGNLSAPAMLKAGETTYLGADRWGDYTTTVVDPADDLSFWTVGLHSTTSTTWATWWSYVKIAPVSRGHAVKH